MVAIVGKYLNRLRSIRRGLLIALIPIVGVLVYGLAAAYPYHFTSKAHTDALLKHSTSSVNNVVNHSRVNTTTVGSKTIKSGSSYKSHGTNNKNSPYTLEVTADGKVIKVPAKPSPADGKLLFSVPEANVKEGLIGSVFYISAADGEQIGSISNPGTRSSCDAQVWTPNNPPAMAADQPAMIAIGGNQPPTTCQVGAMAWGQNGKRYSGSITVHILPPPDFSLYADTPQYERGVTTVMVHVKTDPDYAGNYPTPEVSNVPCNGLGYGGPVSFIGGATYAAPNDRGSLWTCYTQYFSPAGGTYPVKFTASDSHYTHSITVNIQPIGDFGTGP